MDKGARWRQNQLPNVSEAILDHKPLTLSCHLTSIVRMIPQKTISKKPPSWAQIANPKNKEQIKWFF